MAQESWTFGAHQARFEPPEAFAMAVMVGAGFIQRARRLTRPVTGPANSRDEAANARRRG